MTVKRKTRAKKENIFGSIKEEMKRSS